MADVKKSLLLMGTLGIILLILVIVFSVALLVGNEFKEQICLQDGGQFNNGVNCTTIGNTSSLFESQAYNASETLIAQIILVVGFIGLVVLTAIGAILIGMAKGFMEVGEL